MSQSHKPLAEYLIAQGKCQFYEFPAIAILELRELQSVKRKLKKQEKSLKVRIRNSLLALYFHEIDLYVEGFGQNSLMVICLVTDSCVFVRSLAYQNPYSFMKDIFHEIPNHLPNAHHTA